MSDASTTRPAEYEPGNDTDSLLYAVRVLRERWWIVAASALACMVIAVGLSVTRGDTFEATSNVLFAQSGPADAALGIQRDSANPEREAATQVLVATSPEVTDRARRALRTETSRADLVEQVTVESAENADVLTFTAAADAPREAAAIANAFARSYVAFTRETEAGQIDETLAQVEEQIQAAPADSPERAELIQRRSSLQSLQSAADGGTKLIGSAEPPSTRSSPTPKRDALLGLIIGVVLGLTIAFLVDLFDRRVKSVDEFERLYGMRALASIPQLSFSARTQEDRAVGFEPYRVLRNAIGFAELTRDLDAIMVTSAMPAEGKSSVSMNLARAIALSGQRVVLVECDLRRPAVARHLGIEDPGGGLTTALVGRRPVADLLRPVTPGLAHFSVLPSGPLPPNAAELLRSPRMAALLAELKRDGTRVILDAPPLLPVADAQGLLDHPQIDAALLVARAMQTTREEARRARAVLDQHRLQPLGLVVTGLKEERSYGYYGADPGGVPSGRKTATEPVEREEATRS